MRERAGLNNQRERPVGGSRSERNPGVRQGVSECLAWWEHEVDWGMGMEADCLEGPVNCAQSLAFSLGNCVVRSEGRIS